MSAARRCTSGYLVYYASLILMTFVLRTECFRWIKSVYEGNVFANRSSVALFRWKYVLDGSDSASLKIKCGYLQKTAIGTTDLVSLVKKKGHNVGMTLVGRLPGSANSQVEAYQENLPGGGVDRSVVGFRIMFAQLTHPRQFQCLGIYRVGVDDLDESRSVVKNLVVLDPPIILGCLADLHAVKENEDVEFSCYVTGNPPPTLQCLLRSGLGEVLKKYPPTATIANITRHMFKQVDRDAEEIMCVADGGIHTGKTNVTMSLEVHHTPRAPDYVHFIPATNHSSLNIMWSEIPINETGGEITEYKIVYYETKLGRFSRSSISLSIEKITPIDGYFTYQITGLNPDAEYTVEVIGVNAFGDGHYEPKEVVPSSIERLQPNDEKASVGVIIGGIIAGIVFIVIFVILAVWCSTRNKKHEKFPTSHVEDAVDYPPGVGQSLYANIDKNKNKTSRAGSTNEYPDVVNDTSEMRPMVGTASYEPSNKAFV